MKDVNISAKNIGSSVVADTATINSLTASATVDTGAERELIGLLVQHCESLRADSTGLTPMQLQQIAELLREGMKQLSQERNQAKRQNILAEVLDKVKGVGGATVAVLETFFKLRTLFGV